MKKEPKPPKNIGDFRILKLIAKGGMGEIYLAEDPACKRQVALKRMRPELFKHAVLRKRFLKEAFITAKLSHPVIISIYSIHKDKDTFYYTMPYVEGETLKEILRTQRKENSHSFKPLHTLLRHFLNICNCVAYIHNRNIIHRDLKPENILIGKYGEVQILDWGLAKYVGESCELSNLDLESPYFTEALTVLGKVVGTPSYLAPERAKKQAADYAQDIYSLGVILYYILTLHLPFKRASVKEFIKHIDKEELIPPSELAPYRDIPKNLEYIVEKCLEPNPKERYQRIEDLVKDMQGYFEGRSEWHPIESLELSRKSDWEFQENVLLLKHLALSRTEESLEWVNLMISQNTYPGNVMLHTRVKITKEGEGIGFLINVPEKSLRRQPNEGFCIWLGSSKEAPSRLFRSSFKILDLPNVSLEPGRWHELKIEKIDKHLYLHLDRVCHLSYLFHIPLEGSHIGVLLKSHHLSVDPISVYSGSQSVKVSCLAVPDAFLSQHLYDIALSEYRRIGHSFPGRAEGREALFRAGITLLERAKHETNQATRKALLQSSLEEFENLRPTPGAPLEYLGKALVYQALSDNLEEVKCLELALRKFRSHPLIAIFREHITFRLLEASHQHRKATLRFMLLVSLFFPEDRDKPDLLPLFDSLQNTWEIPYFFREKTSKAKAPTLHLELFLSFWTGREALILDIADKLHHENKLTKEYLLETILGLLELQSKKHALEFIEKVMQAECFNRYLKDFVLFKEHITQNSSIPLDEVHTSFRGNTAIYSYFYHFEKKELIEAKEALKYIPKIAKPFCELWQALSERNLKESEVLLKKHVASFSKTDASFFRSCLYGIKSGEEAALSYIRKEAPDTKTLSSLVLHYIPLSSKSRSKWELSLVPWERKNLYRQLALYSYAIDKPKQAASFLKKIDLIHS